MHAASAHTGHTHTCAITKTLCNATTLPGPEPQNPPAVPPQEAVSCKHTLYVIVTRDPVDRTVSAYNFNTQLVGTPLIDDGNVLVKLQACFPHPGAPQAFAEALDADTECGALARAFLHEPSVIGKSHIGKGHAYYLRDTGLLEVLWRSRSTKVRATCAAQ